jgi:ParB family chromosome partitioning protein
MVLKPKGLGRGLSALLPEAEAEFGGSGSWEVPIRDIKPNPHQPRRDFDQVELDELAASIKSKGIIQPLVVKRDGAGYTLIAGERRLRAAQIAGLTNVPVRIIDLSGETDLLEMSLIENLQRNDLNPVELAEGYRNLQQKWGLTQEQIAGRVGKERATVANTIRLLDLPAPILDSLRKGEITAGHAKVILSLEGAARQSALWKKILELKLSVRQAEEVAQSANAEAKKPRKKTPVEQSPFITDCTDRIRRSLGTQVSIQKKGKKGFVRIEFYSNEDLMRLVEMMEDKRSW